MHYKKKLLNKLYIITPFKDNNLKLLKKTIKSLSNKKTSFSIFQLIIYDKSCSKLITKYKTDGQIEHNKTHYFNKFIQAKSAGIYSSINEGLKYFENWIVSPKPCSLKTTIFLFSISSPFHSFIFFKVFVNLEPLYS